MKHTILTLILAAGAGLAFAPAPAAAAPPNAAEMSKLAFFAGTWDCRWSAGAQSGALVATFTPVMDGAWLEETEAVTMGDRSIVQTMHFTGFDPATKHWIHGGPNADGTYEVAQSDDLATWTNLFPSGGGVGKLVRPSESEYVLSEAFQQDGKALTYVDDCKKRS
ncbi:MAG: hypothetical protein ACLQPV_01580 [Vulcanimicrobiaceae bacterium]